MSNIDVFMSKSRLSRLSWSNKESIKCESCINGTRDDALFIDANDDDYHLDTLSIAIGQGQVIPTITIDLEDSPRDTEPDIGCYEYQK